MIVRQFSSIVHSATHSKRFDDNTNIRVRLVKCTKRTPNSAIIPSLASAKHYQNYDRAPPLEQDQCLSTATKSSTHLIKMWTKNELELKQTSPRMVHDNIHSSCIKFRTSPPNSLLSPAPEFWPAAQSCRVKPWSLSSQALAEATITRSKTNGRQTI